MILKRLHIISLLLTTLLVFGCTDRPSTDGINWNVSLDKESKEPYGTYIAYNSLKYYFPEAKRIDLSKQFRFTNIDWEMMYPEEGKSLLLLVGLDFFLSEQEVNQLLDFAGRGNDIVLFCSALDEKLEKRLKCNKARSSLETTPLGIFYNGKQNQEVLTLLKNKTDKYGYQGRTITNYFSLPDKSKGTVVKDTAEDSDTGSIVNYIQQRGGNYDEEEYYDEDDDEYYIGEPQILGYAEEKPNIIKYEIGSGSFTIHAAPLVMSNYFLLQPGNTNYLDRFWAALQTDEPVAHVYWSGYYRRRAEGSDFGTLWKYPSTRWALILAIITILLYVIFEGKRRQRIIPIIEQPENTSVSFVETVGELYYNKGNHANLAEKMTQHFLEWVRSNYYLNTNHINEQFAEQLILKSGLPPNMVKELVVKIQEVQMNAANVDEAYLYQLYTSIQKFYKNHK